MGALRIRWHEHAHRPAPRQPGPGRAHREDGQDLGEPARSGWPEADHAAFEAVYDQLAGPVYGLVRKVLRDPAQSEEVAQEVLLEVWRAASRFDPARGSATAWVMTIAHRRAVDRVRSESAVREARAEGDSPARSPAMTSPSWWRPGARPAAGAPLPRCA